MRGNYIKQLNFTRFIAAFLIVFFHFGEELFYIENSLFEIIRSNFNLGVSYFYVLSGFVMMLAYGKLNKVNFYDYYLNRLARIFPLHLISLLLFLVIFMLIGHNIRYSFFSLLAHITLIQSWVPRYVLMYNVPAWSISVELFFYLTFPFLFNLFIQKYKFRIIFIFIIALWLLTQVSLNIYYFSEFYGGFDKVFMMYNPLLHLPSFLIGILCGEYFNKRKKVYMKKHSDISIVLLVFFCCSIIIIYPELFYHNGLLAPIFGLIILFVAEGQGLINKMFTHPFLVYLGEISFAIYLLQTPIYKLMNHLYFTININEPYIKFTLSFMALIIASHLTFKYIESPARIRIREVFGRKKQQ